MINPLILGAVAPGFMIDVSPLSSHAELDQRWIDLINTDAVKVPPGWVPLVLDMFVAIQRVMPAGKDASIPLNITKIFEDDGEMRVVYNTRSRAVHNLIQGYVKQAEDICENCGWPGTPSSVFGAGFSSHCPVCAFLFNVKSYR